MRIFESLGRVLTKWAGSSRALLANYFGPLRGVNYSRSAGDLYLSSIVSPCVGWIQRTLPEAPLVVYRYETVGGREVKRKVRKHRLMEIFQQPNAYYGMTALWAGTVADYVVTGNAYWLIRRMSETDERVASIWWIPSFMMEPVSESDRFIDYYKYTVDGLSYRIALEDVVHFQDGFDPRNPRKGRSSLASMIREIATDNEAANWSVALLANMGVPGVVISAAQGAMISKEDAEVIKNDFSQNFTGVHRGRPMVLSGPVEVKNIAFSPQQMNVRDTRRIPEERVSAAIGVPAGVVGLGAGLDRNTFSNMAEARESAYESCIIPMQRNFAEQLQRKLVPNFEDPLEFFVEFDLTEVRVLQEDRNRLHQRTREDVKSGIISLNEGRARIGELPLDNDVWYVTKTVEIVEIPTPVVIEELPSNVSVLPPPQEGVS